jgi:type I restriction enzyme S subunit
MKNGWTTNMLADVCEVFADGDWVESKDQSPEGIRLIQTGNVGKGIFKDRAEKARYISEATFKRLRCTEIFEGDCLISRLPDPAGRSCILPDTGERMITAVDCTIIRFNSKQVIPEFFNYYTQSRDYLKDVDSETTGTTRKRISRSKLGEVQIPVPPLPEQQRIVGILDKAFDGIATANANAEKNLQNARALFESRLQSVFTQRGTGWVEKTIAECFKVRSGDFLPARAMVDSGDFDVYGGNGINGKHDKKNLTGDNIIIGRVGAKCGNVRYVKGDLWVTDNAVFISEYLCPFDLRFLARLLERKDLRNRANQMAQPVISYTTIKNVLLAFPVSTDEQKEIANKLDTFEEETQRLASLYERKIAAVEALKKSLLHQAFNGNL